MSRDPLLRLHIDWRSMVQPTGLFLAPRVLADTGAAPTEPVLDVQAATAALVVDGVLQNPWDFFSGVLAWPEHALVRGSDVPADLALALDGGVRVVPDFALHDLDEGEWVLLGMIVGADVDLDAATDDAVWSASAQQRFDRLLRAKECPVGVLTNHRSVRVVYAPRGEPTAYATWHLRDLITVAGRPLLAALHMCLNAPRLLTLDGDQRLPALFARSREFQNSVSTRLQGQVLDALQELLDGLQRADRVTDGRLLAPWRATDDDRQAIYHGLVTALLRMVFVLFAEERRLLPLDARIYRESYSLTNLHARLQEDHARLGRGLDARYGAWARVVALFRMLYEGIDARGVPEGFRVPPRRGEFFEPDRFAFLEGRDAAPRAQGVPLELPKISDGTVYRVLDRLLVLDGERLKYSDLAVEQIGSVYEGIMGYTLELSEGRALRVRVGSRESGALDMVIDLQRFADLSRDEFVKHLTEVLELKLTDGTAKAIKKAASEADVATALSQQRTFKNLTSIERGWMYLQPGQERRRSGSHYTPRSLTQPIVERTLKPILDRLGEHPRPDAILALRVCDPAMGSGAFLVETCRQLAVQLEAAWMFHGETPAIPADEDPLLHARRLVAQRCLYGVDRNHLAVDIARLSLWLETFARDHAFTFLDHCLRHGDSLVGLSLNQIEYVSLAPKAARQPELVAQTVKRTLAEVRRLRDEIHVAGDGDPPDNEGQRKLWGDVQGALYHARTVGNLVVAGFFAQKTDRERVKWLRSRDARLHNWLAGADDESALPREVAAILAEHGLVPFHWPLEFPEVFDGGGFDAFVGNPPFLGGKRISTMLGEPFRDWLAQAHEGVNSNADLVAHFFRRAFALLRDGGTLGLIATNTISQGDTRRAGLRWICTHDGTIFNATRRYRWPGLAAVVVSVVHIMRSGRAWERQLDGRAVEDITAFLFHRGGSEDPDSLPENTSRSFIGCDLKGQGFLFADDDPGATPIAEMQRLLARDARNQERTSPYLGGEELNTDPTQTPCRYAIDFGEMSMDEARFGWPDLMAIVDAKVKPDRAKKSKELAEYPFWIYWRPRRELRRAIQGKARVLVTSQTSSIRTFAFVDAGIVFSHKIVVFPFEQYAPFAMLQSRAHVDWAAFFGSTMKDDPVYTPSDCFETFPFPSGWETNAALDDIGRRYHEHRAAIMKRTVGTKRPEGLTATYNRFHDRNERDREIAALRALHAEMDRAVLDAYGWTDIAPVYDYRVQLDERVRLTWDDDTRDEVLARLLEENRRRAGTAAATRREREPDDGETESAAEQVRAAPTKATKRGRPKRNDDGGTPGLPGVG